MKGKPTPKAPPPRGGGLGALLSAALGAKEPPAKAPPPKSAKPTFGKPTPGGKGLAIGERPLMPKTVKKMAKVSR